MWVQLLVPQRIEIAGSAKHYQPGDWVEVGKQQAHYWFDRNVAWSPEVLTLPEGCGVVVPTANLAPQFGRLEMVVGQYTLPFERNVIWDGKTPLDGRVLVGLQLLDVWQMAAPVYSYDELAWMMGSEEDRAKTKAIVHDLRIPVYNPHLLFVRRDAETERLFALWRDDHEGDARLALMRAVYQVKPMVLPLPQSWSK